MSDAIEIVRFTAVEGREDELPEAIARGLTVQGADPNCVEIKVYRSIERPNEVLATLNWTTVEAHNEWRAAHRDEWRAKVGWDIIEGGAPQGLAHYTFVTQVK